MKRLAKSLALLAALCSSSVPSVHSADAPKGVIRTDSNKNAVAEKTLLLADDRQLLIDPRTGEVIKSTKKPSRSSGSTSDDTTDSASRQSAPWKPYDFFIADSTVGSVLNSYFLSQLSMGVYSDALEESTFHEDLMQEFSDQGIPGHAIEVEMDAARGAEVAAFRVNNDALVIAFRGTSAEGTRNPDEDKKVDLHDYPLKVKVNNKECRIHQGFWESTDAVYDWVFQQALNAHLDGRRIYLTGHSLGGARATVAAFRLHYDDRIPVESLQTFGSPKVGDLDFKLMFGDVGPDGVKLWNVTERFVVLGDPATTFPEKEPIIEGKKVSVVYYEHVGKTHNINPLTGTHSEHYSIDFDGDEVFFVPTISQWAGFLTGAGDNEHMLYDDALLHEVINDPEYIEIKDLLIDHQSVEQ